MTSVVSILARSTSSESAASSETVGRSGVLTGSGSRRWSAAQPLRSTSRTAARSSGILVARFSPASRASVIFISSHERTRDRGRGIRNRQRLSQRQTEYLELADRDRERGSVHLRVLPLAALRGHRPAGRLRRAQLLRLVSLAVWWEESYRASG